MYITPEIIADIERKYGNPDELAFAYEMSGREFDLVRRSQKNGRAHDVTLFIITNQNIVVIKKPMYTAGAYRAPSGGVNPGESFEEGAIREAHEETGLRVELGTYIVRARVRFSFEGAAIDWTTHVFSAGIVSGRLAPIDTREVVEARLASIEELTGQIRGALLASGSTGLRYRAELTDAVIDRLLARGLLTAPH